MMSYRTLKNIFVRPRLKQVCSKYLSSLWSLVRFVPRSSDSKAPSRGVALLLVTFVVALASIVVTNLAYSTYLAARANSVIERSLYAEYLMKSAANVAGAFLLASKSVSGGQSFEGPQEAWALFSKGQAIPLETLGITDPHITLTLELTPENAKFPLKSVAQSGAAPSTVNRNRLTSLFQFLGFDKDTEKDSFGKFKGRHFSSTELVSNLIDYISTDSEQYNVAPFPRGVKSELPANFFPGKSPESIGQLKMIPGMTSMRMRKIQPLLTTYNTTINVNFAPPIILKSLSPRLDGNDIAAIIKARENKNSPIQNPNSLRNLVNATAQQDLTDALIQCDSNSGTGSGTEAFFQVIAKVELGVKNYYMRSILLRDTSTKEISVREFQLF